MEPKYSMTAYIVCLGVGLTALAARGFGLTVAAIAAGILLVGLAFEVSYRARRHEQRVLGPRRALDRIVRRQWLGIGIFGCAIGGTLQVAGVAPLDRTHDVLQALTVGLVVAASAIYVSSLVDWYWVLPKIAGMVGLAPCERAGGDHFAGVTKVWFFHRAAATTIVTFVLAAVPGYMAGATGAKGAASTGWVVLGAALAIGYNSVNNGLTPAFRNAFNPRFIVGDIIRVRADPEDRKLQDAYVVDVSIAGLKYKLKSALSDPAAFTHRGTLLPMEAIARTSHARHAKPVCPNVGQCRAVNWYCFRNGNANGRSGSDESAPLPYGDTRAGA